MTENEAIKRCDMLINGMSINNATNRAFEEDGKDYPTFATMKEFAQTCRKALEEIQQYRAIGTVEDIQSMKDNGAFSGMELAQIASMQMKLKEYQAIGTIDEFKALKEKNTPLEHHHTRIDDINDKVRVSVCPSCLSIIFTHSEEYPNFCVACGQKLDWSE